VVILFNKLIKRKYLFTVFFLCHNSWRRGQKCVDNSIDSKSVCRSSISKKKTLFIVFYSFIDEYDPTIGIKFIYHRFIHVFIYFFRGFVSKTSCCRR
jgi:hypothetical protein